MSSPPLRGTAEWSATREVALLLGLTGGNRYAAQQLWLRKERIKAEASQFASAGSQQASQQPAGCRAKPATAKAQGVPKRSSPAQLAKKSRRLNQKHLASKMWACVRVASRLLAWCVRARARTTVYSSGGEIGRLLSLRSTPHRRWAGRAAATSTDLSSTQPLSG